MNLERQKVIDRVVGIPALVLLKPLVTFLGWILRRDHDLRPKGRIVVIKMLGGGSLVIAYPALLGLRRAHPDLPMTLVTTRSIAPFARTLGVFDSIEVLDHGSAPRLLLTTLVALWRTMRSDSVLDLEVYSKLTTVFSLMTLARNRLGFYLENVLWRKPIQTHLVFFNRFAPRHLFYERVTRLLGAEPAEYDECRGQIQRTLGIHGDGREGIAVGTGCSELGRERMFSADQWLEIIRLRLDRDPSLQGAELRFLGSSGDSAMAEEIGAALVRHGLPLRAVNHCGRLSLADSLRVIASSREYWGIDSALLHYARLLCSKIVSFWGPTAPSIVLKPFPIEDEHFFSGVPCSPCVHVAEFPPCAGRNLCMTSLIRPLTDEERRSLPPIVQERRR